MSAFEDLALFAGYLITTHARVQRPVRASLPAQGDDLGRQYGNGGAVAPAGVQPAARATVVAFLEPAYEVGGDCFDYAVNGPLLDLAIMGLDGPRAQLGRLLAGLAIGCYRHYLTATEPRSKECTSGWRPQSRDFLREAKRLSWASWLSWTWGTGHLHWTNARHPPPLHIRDGKVISQLRCEPTLPWGLGTGAISPAVALEVLEPGDRLLFYTDGVVDSKKTSPESAFGLERLADLAGQTASSELSPGQVVRKLILGGRRPSLQRVGRPMPHC